QESTPHGWQQPSPHRALDIREIPGIVDDYRKAAERAKAEGLTGLSFTRLTATCPINFYRMASISEPICMVVPSKIDPASCFKWWKHWFRCGAATVSRCASHPAELGMESRIAIRSRCSTTW